MGLQIDFSIIIMVIYGSSRTLSQFLIIFIIFHTVFLTQVVIKEHFVGLLRVVNLIVTEHENEFNISLKWKFKVSITLFFVCCFSRRKRKGFWLEFVEGEVIVPFSSFRTLNIVEFRFDCFETFFFWRQLLSNFEIFMSTQMRKIRKGNVIQVQFLILKGILFINHLLRIFIREFIFGKKIDFVVLNIVFDILGFLSFFFFLISCIEFIRTFKHSSSEFRLTLRIFHNVTSFSSWSIFRFIAISCWLFLQIFFLGFRFWVFFTETYKIFRNFMKLYIKLIIFITFTLHGFWRWLFGKSFVYMLTEFHTLSSLIFQINFLKSNEIICNILKIQIFGTLNITEKFFSVSLILMEHQKKSFHAWKGKNTVFLSFVLLTN